MKKIAALLSGCLFAVAAVAEDSSGSQVFQMRLVVDKPSGDSQQMVLVYKAGDKSMDETLYVEKNVLLDQMAVKSAKAVRDSRGQPEIEITFTKAGGRQLAEVTRQNIGKRLAIIIDGRLYEAPVIRDGIPGGVAEISGHFTQQEAERLARRIEEKAKG